MPKRLGENYSPIYFLSALGAGGLTVAFFMYLQFLIPHKGTPAVSYTQVIDAIMVGNWLSAISIIAVGGILYFGYFHFKLLLWNIREEKAFRLTDAYVEMRNSNAEVTLMTMPLTYAMTLNVGFVIFALMPNAWSIVEYIFPFALAGFAIIGAYAGMIFLEYFGRIIMNGGFNFETNNNLSQMISIFAFTMIAVGFAGPAAMSENHIYNLIGIVGSVIFLTIAGALTIFKFTIGFTSILKTGIGAEGAPSLWIIIPILTLGGISIVRLIMSAAHHFDAEVPHILLTFITISIFALQISFGVMGYYVLKKLNYFEKYIESDVKSIGSFAIICPGVATTIFGFFIVSYGFVLTGAIEHCSLCYFVMLTPFILIHIQTIRYFLKLKKKFFDHDIEHITENTSVIDK